MITTAQPRRADPRSAAPSTEPAGRGGATAGRTAKANGAAETDGPAAAGTPAKANGNGNASRQRPRAFGRRGRILLFLAGWVLVAIGIAGLVLPGIQGIVTILAGVAVLSLVSRTAHGWTRRVLRRWPTVLRRVERFRYKIRRRFGKRNGAAERAQTEAQTETRTETQTEPAETGDRVHLA